jgi:hypothetical protein
MRYDNCILLVILKISIVVNISQIKLLKHTHKIFLIHLAKVRVCLENRILSDIFQRPTV